MDELIARISAAIGVEAEVAKLAAGHVLGFLQKAFPEGPAADLIINIPGAQEAMAAAAAPSLGGGLIGGLLGGLGGLVRGPQGEMFALAGRLGAVGLTKEQIQGLAKEIFDYAEQLIGKENLETIKNAIPGLSHFLQSP